MNVDARGDLLGKLRTVATRMAGLPEGPVPFHTVIEDVISPTEVVIDGRRTLLLGSNNYLGLTFHPEVLAAAHAALDRHGSGTTGSRVANGTLGIHEALQSELADAFGKRHALVFTTGHQANTSLLSALCGPGDTVILDAESHASLHDGARLSGADVLVFRHNDVEDLERKLSRLPRRRRDRLVVTEGLFSIRADVAPLPAIGKACRAHGAYLLVDEAHSFGVYGDRGLGVAEMQGALGRVDFVTGTFSKALGGVGGFVVSDHAELPLLHVAARGYVFTAAGTPATVAAARAALAVLLRDDDRRRRVRDAARALRRGLRGMGLAVGPEPGPDDAPIVPVVVGTASAAVAAWQALLAAGVYVNLVLPPGCPRDACQLRASVSAAHEPAEIARALDAFARAVPAARAVAS